MLKDRSELEKYLIKIFTSSISNKHNMTPTQEWCMELYNKYNIPISMSTDIFSQRKDLSEHNKFVLFAITDIVANKKITEFFTEQEIKLFTGQKYELNKIKLPLKFHLIKINDEQYIGKTTAQFLMQLREAQLINYNANTQRALKIMLKGGTKIMRPYINDKAVDEISELYEDRIFIPNMITLNINADDENANYYYDDKTETLTINDITTFDIADGYHRYLGMSRNYDRDNNWDYSMMLQISLFSVGKARQMIWQEDHQTKMKITDSDSYNQYNAGNEVVKRLNNDTECNLYNKIDINDGLVDAGILAKIIDRLWFEKKHERKDIIISTKAIKQGINRFTEENIEFLEKNWKKYEIYIIMYGIYNDNTSTQINAALNNIPKDNIDTIQKSKLINNKVMSLLKEVY